MIAWQDHDDRFLCHQFVLEIGLLHSYSVTLCRQPGSSIATPSRAKLFHEEPEAGKLSAEKGDIKLSTLQAVCKHCRVVARNPDFDIEQFVAKDACRMRQPIDFLPG